MGYNIEVRLEALLDAQAAIDYYDAISIDLGNRFENELHVTFKKIAAHPQYYKFYFKKAREKI